MALGEKTLYLDCFSGISGDMFLGAMIDLGFTPSMLEWELQKLNLPDAYHLHVFRENRMGIQGVRFEVHEGRTHGEACQHVEERELRDAQSHQHDCGHHHHEHEHSHSHSHHHHQEHEHGRSLASIRQLIESSTLSTFVKQHALSLFDRIGKAEAKVHGVSLEEVHFHEVGSLDSIVDIIGACLAIEHFKVANVTCRPLIEGTGSFRCAHGTFPLPGPATLEILAGVPLQQIDTPFELITPTGAAIVREFATRFEPFTMAGPSRIGYGLGKRTLPDRPNALRAVLMDGANNPTVLKKETILVLEANIDDATGEELGHALDLLLKAGALDASLLPLQMKKNRPGVLLKVICEPAHADELAILILRHTGTFGVRMQTWDRIKLRRETVQIETPYGAIRIKKGYLGDELVHTTPEYEDCRTAAGHAGVPLRTVMQAALASYNHEKP